MRKMIMTAVAAAMATTAMTPAMAAPISLSSLPLAQQNAIKAVCTTAENGQFVGTPKDLDATVIIGFEKSRETIENIPSGVELSRTAANFDVGSEHKNGQSPNVFGDFTSLVTYSGGINKQKVVTVDRTKVTFGCAMSKDNGLTYPQGQQIANDGSLFVNYDANETTTYPEVSAPDYTLPFTEDRVICNSPTKNPGVWRNQNGYTGTCNTALYVSVNPGGTHSNSVPGVSPLRPNTDHFEALPLDALEAPQIVLDDEVA